MSFGGESIILLLSAVSDLPSRIHIHSQSVCKRRSTSHWVTSSNCASSNLHKHTHGKLRPIIHKRQREYNCHIRIQLSGVAA